MNDLSPDRSAGTFPTERILHARGKALAFADEALLTHYRNTRSKYHIKEARRSLAELRASLDAAEAALANLEAAE